MQTFNGDFGMDCNTAPSISINIWKSRRAKCKVNFTWRYVILMLRDFEKETHSLLPIWLYRYQ